MKKDKEHTELKDICPECGEPTELIVSCYNCGNKACVENCHTAGVGTMCDDCEEDHDQELDEEDEEQQDEDEEDFN